jgi:hypothetical protein
MDINTEAQELRQAVKDNDGVTAARLFNDVGSSGINDLMQAYYKQADVPPLVITNTPDGYFNHLDLGIKDSGPNRPTTIIPLVKDLVINK